MKKNKTNEIQQEIDLIRLKGQIDAGEITRENEFYFGGENNNLFLMCLQLGLNKNSEKFIDFLSSDFGPQIFREKMLIYVWT